MTEDERERVRLGHAMERLLASPEWTLFLEWMQGDVSQSHYQTAMKPLSKMDDALPVEYAKGTLNGIQLTLTRPTAIVLEMRAILAEQAQKDDRDDPGSDRINPGYEREPDDDLDLVRARNLSP